MGTHKEDSSERAVIAASPLEVRRRAEHGGRPAEDAANRRRVKGRRVKGRSSSTTPAHASPRPRPRSRPRARPTAPSASHHGLLDAQVEFVTRSAHWPH